MANLKPRELWTHKEMRHAYGQALVDIAATDPRIVVLDADCKSSMGTGAFEKAYPDRYINCGIMEANAVGVSAGLSSEGFIPYFSTFAVFTSRRPYDQVVLACAYSKQNVKLIGWDVGIAGGANGGTHMSIEDIGIMRNIPNMTVIEFTDTTMLKNLMPKINAHKGNVYARSVRKSVTDIYQDNATFEIGKASLIKEGSDLTIIACGAMVKEVMQAVEILESEGINCRVIDMFTIKPIDKDIIIESAQKTGAILTVENHSIYNGLGSAVAEVCSESYPVTVKRMGIPDVFGEVGDYEYLKGVMGLRVEDIVREAKALQKG